MFRQAAAALHRSQTQLGHFLRRMKAKLGPLGATMATARKIAVIFYTMVKNQIEYDHSIWAEQETQRQRQHENRLKRQAARLGYLLIPQNANPQSNEVDVPRKSVSGASKDKDFIGNPPQQAAVCCANTGYYR